MMDKLLLTPEDAAEALSVGRSKLYELIGDGVLETVTIGACRRVPRAALDDFVDRLRTARAVVPARPTGITRAGAVEHSLPEEGTQLMLAMDEATPCRSARAS